MPCDSPRILHIKSKPLHILREVAIACRSRGCPICIIDRKLAWVRCVKGRIPRERVQRLLIPRKLAAKYRLMNEIHAELERVAAVGMPKVISQLVFFLVPQRREVSDRGG